METVNMDGSEVQETTEVAEETTETPTPEEIAELKRKAEVSSQNFERAKKAEAELKEAREKLKTVPSQSDLSTDDILFIAKADIHEDDIATVRDWAKFKGISVKEAFKDLKATLDTKAEERKTASATQTRGGARGSAKVTGEDFLQKAEKGELPDTEDDWTKLAEARLARRKK